MTDNAIWIHEGSEVNQLISMLQNEYILHYNLIQLWRHGDPTSRRRMFIVGFHKSLGEHANEFSFPEPLFDEFHAPCAAHIAVPDAEVSDIGLNKVLMSICYHTVVIVRVQVTYT